MTLKCSIARVAPSFVPCDAGAHIVEPITTTTNSVEIIAVLSTEFPFSLKSLSFISVLLIYGLWFWERNTQGVFGGVSVAVVVVNTCVPLRLK
jgi:hypothetical protein